MQQQYNRWLYLLFFHYKKPQLLKTSAKNVIFGVGLGVGGLEWGEPNIHTTLTRTGLYYKVS
jgi:hypothetical protein